MALCKAFPGLISPSHCLTEHYKLFDPEFTKSLSGEDLFLLDLMSLSEFNRRENERNEEDRNKDKEKLTPDAAMDRVSKLLKPGMEVQ